MNLELCTDWTLKLNPFSDIFLLNFRMNVQRKSIYMNNFMRNLVSPYLVEIDSRTPNAILCFYDYWKLSIVELLHYFFFHENLQFLLVV